MRARSRCRETNEAAHPHRHARMHRNAASKRRAHHQNAGEMWDLCETPKMTALHRTIGDLSQPDGAPWVSPDIARAIYRTNTTDR